jgi:hypothetical protein
MTTPKDHSSSSAVRQGNSVGLGDANQDNSVALWHRLLRESIDESGWKHEAVALAIGLSRENGKHYLSKMLSEEKPITAKHLAALPYDIKVILARRNAEALGLIVVRPLSGEEAQRAFVAGALGLLAGSAMSFRMAKASIADAVRTAVNE